MNTDDVTITFNLEAVKDLLKAAADEELQSEYHDGPEPIGKCFSQEVVLDMHADRDGDNCELTEARVIFKFRK